MLQRCKAPPRALNKLIATRLRNLGVAHLNSSTRPISPAPRQLRQYASTSTHSWSSPQQAGDPGTGLEIVDPLLIYRAKVARGELEEDEEQLRALVELRNLNRILIDYEPPAHLLGILSGSSNFNSLAPAPVTESDTLNRLRNVDARKPILEQQDHNSNIDMLVRWMSDSESLEQLGVPRGLMLTGPPGTGKSMAADIFFDSLPTKRKFRRHYHFLCLEIYRLIWKEAERRRIALRGGAPPTPLALPDDITRNDLSSSGPRTVEPKVGTGVQWKRGGAAGLKEGKAGWRRVLEGMPFFRPDSLSDNDAPLPDLPSSGTDVSNTTLPLHAAASLFLNHGHVLLFDEVQLVDIASAGLLRRVLEGFWKLGGVVVATSNRIPEDLYASNVQRGQLVAFLEMLRERCPVHEMRADRDFRRKPFAGWSSIDTPGGLENLRRATYFVPGEEDQFESAVQAVVRGRKGQPSSITVYGRTILVPFSVAASPDGETSVCRFTFEQLCDSPLGPADYLSIASTYQTIIVDRVPQLTLTQKNQARRLITFLDAVYEAGSRLVLLADSAPDDLFFPDAAMAAAHSAKGPAAGPVPLVGYPLQAEPDDVVDMSARGAPSPFRTPPPGKHYPEEDELERQRAEKAPAAAEARRAYELMSSDMMMSETLSEANQDTEEGFRPNISSYADRPSRRTRSDDDEGGSSKMQRSRIVEPGTESAEEEKRRKENVPFKHLAIFTGEDERFAYQRAVSRIFEMSHPSWALRRSWRPLDLANWDSTRLRAETGPTLTPAPPTSTVRSDNRMRTEASVSDDFADEASYEAATFPARQAGAESGQPLSGRRKGSEGPPIVSPVHVWGVREDWGPRAGAWGKGAAGRREGEEGEEEGQARPRRRGRSDKQE